MSKPLDITIFDNGPIRLSAEGVRVTFCGAPATVEEGKDVYLCRCGQSANAPFCDGSHQRTGFTAEPAAPADKGIRTWEGRTIRTFFNADVCMHVGHCRPLESLRAAELAGDDAAAAEIARVVLTCPSGALTYEAQGLAAPPAQDAPDIEIMEGGEVRVQRAFTINAERPAKQPEDRATLCRCGLSKSKPWCDGRHRKRRDFR